MSIQTLSIWVLGMLLSVIWMTDANGQSRRRRGKKVSLRADDDPKTPRKRRSSNRRNANIHRDQDDEIAPYTASIQASGKFSSQSQSVEAEGIDAEGTDSQDLEFNLNYLFRGGSVFFGPLIGYTMSKIDDDSRSSIDVGGIVDFTVGDIDRDVMVPHIYGGARYNTEVFEGSDQSASGYRVGAGGGIYYFLASNIALDIKLEYQYKSLSLDQVTVNSSIITAGFGLAAFVD